MDLFRRFAVGRRDESLGRLVDLFVEADTWAASRALVERHPELLTDSAEDLLARSARDAEGVGDEHRAHVFEAHRELLGRCREAGIAEAFDEVMGAGMPAALRPGWADAAAAQDRYLATRDSGDLDAAAGAFSAVVRDPLFPDASDRTRAMATYALGALLADRFLLRSRPTDLDEAVEMFQAAVAAAPDGCPDLPEYTSALGIALGIRFERTGHRADLVAGIDAVRRAVALLPPDAVQLPTLLHNMAANLGVKYDLDGQPGDLDAAIAASRQAVEAGADMSDQTIFTVNFVSGLVSRYERTGALDDLTIAIAEAERAAAAGVGSPEHPVLLATLGDVLQFRFDRDRTGETLDRAIAALEEAVAGLPAGSHHLPVCLGRLGNARLSKFERSGTVADLDGAQAAFERALRAEGPGSPRVALLRGGLGLAFLVRYQRLGEESALDRAVEELGRAVAADAEGSVARPFLLANLAAAHRVRHAGSGDPADLDTATDAYRRACAEGLDTQAEIALEASAAWGGWATERRSWPEAAQAYGFGITCAQRLFEAQAVRADKEVWLIAVANLPAHAAFAFTRAGMPDDGVLALETGRARMHAEALATGSVHLARLRERDEVLAERYKTAAERVRGFGRRELELSRPVWPRAFVDRQRDPARQGGISVGRG
jgi:tetratricopeptide (TPR) repeat protein